MKWQGEQVVHSIVVDMLNHHEKCEERKQKIMEQFTELMQQTTFSSID